MFVHAVCAHVNDYSKMNVTHIVVYYDVACALHVLVFAQTLDMESEAATLDYLLSTPVIVCIRGLLISSFFDRN